MNNREFKNLRHHSGPGGFLCSCCMTFTTPKKERHFAIKKARRFFKVRLQAEIAENYHA